MTLSISLDICTKSPTANREVDDDAALEAVGEEGVAGVVAEVELSVVSEGALTLVRTAGLNVHL